MIMIVDYHDSDSESRGAPGRPVPVQLAGSGPAVGRGVGL